jgi:translation initiation factor 2 gamma subunit (eIF-2gamma)
MQQNRGGLNKTTSSQKPKICEAIYYRNAIVPNSIIVPALASKRVNIDGIIEANSEKLSKKQPLCLTREFHVDALRAQHEYRALCAPSGGDQQQ